MKREVDFLGSALALVGGFFLFSAIKTDSLSSLVSLLLSSWWFWALVILIGGIYLSVILFDKRNKDAEANRIYNEAMRDEKPFKQYILYLRPFEVTNTIKSPGNEMPDSHSGGYDFIQYKSLPTEMSFDLEDLLSNIFKLNYSVIGLGKKKNLWKFGTVSVENEEWTDVIKKLAYYANTLFIIPSDNEGTYWEMDHVVKNNLLYKSLFFMPPLSDSKSLSDKEFWDSAIKAADKLGLILPEYNSRGCLIAFNQNKQITHQSYLYKDIDKTKDLFRNAVGHTHRETIKLRTENA